MPDYRIGVPQTPVYQPVDSPLNALGAGITSGANLGLAMRAQQMKEEMVKQQALDEQRQLLTGYGELHSKYADVPSMQKQIMLKGVIPTVNKLLSAAGASGQIDPTQIDFESDKAPLKELMGLSNAYTTGAIKLPDLVNAVHAIEANHAGNKGVVDLAEKQLSNFMQLETDQRQRETTQLNRDQRQDNYNNTMAKNFAASIGGDEKTRNTMSTNQQSLNQIERAKALIDQTKGQPGGPDQRQMFEVAVSTVRALVGNNTITEGEINQLIPSTYKGQFNKFVEKFSNNPTGLDAQNFIKRYEETLDREHKVISSQMDEAQKRLIGGFEKWATDNPQYATPVFKSYGISHPVFNPGGGGPATPAPAAPAPAPGGTKIGRFTVEVGQ